MTADLIRELALHCGVWTAFHMVSGIIDIVHSTCGVGPDSSMATANARSVWGTDFREDAQTDVLEAASAFVNIGLDVLERKIP